MNYKICARAKKERLSEDITIIMPARNLSGESAFCGRGVNIKDD